MKCTGSGFEEEMRIFNAKNLAHLVLTLPRSLAFLTHRGANLLMDLTKMTKALS